MIRDKIAYYKNKEVVNKIKCFRGLDMLVFFIL